MKKEEEFEEEAADQEEEERKGTTRGKVRGIPRGIKLLVPLKEKNRGTRCPGLDSLIECFINIK